MPFRINARTILQLGAELISSDAIAFYELIKNAFDARSPRVRIDVVVPIPHVDMALATSALTAVDAMAKDKKKQALSDVIGSLSEAVAPGTPGAVGVVRALKQAKSTDGVRDVLREANYILISDSGHGMSLADLQDVYLTIGTRSRLRERSKTGRAADGAPLLGEKGVGRLSAMRLGDHLLVRTTKRGERHWHELDLDWSLFTHESDALLQSVEVAPVEGKEKEDEKESGTILRISGLSAEWSEARLREEVGREVSRFTDPFARRETFPIRLYLNGSPISLPRINRMIFDQAHAVVTAKFEASEDGTAPLRLSGSVDYRLRGTKWNFALEGAHLRSVSKTPTLETLRALGPFELELYWYNRRILSAVDGIGERKQVLKLVNEWGGGISVYRDGFRVNPYGGPDDDWLNLDRSALAASGYKVNRAQIIGRLTISSAENPALRDQTNREGLQDTPELAALRQLLRHVLITEFRARMDRVDKDVISKPLVDLAELEARVAEEEATLDDAITLLRERHPAVARQDPGILSSMQGAARQIRIIVQEAADIAEQYSLKQSELVHLAGLGLMVDILAHELNRATSQTLRTLDDLDGSVPAEVGRRFATLEAQLKTLHKRIRVMDPLSTTARQVKERFDMIAWVGEIVSSHDVQFRRHGINCTIQVVPASRDKLSVKAVKGMVVQVLENLLTNSIYWLKQQKMVAPKLRPTIHVVIDTGEKELSVTDNGPGVDPGMADVIFLPFMTTKPPDQGKGLGLYVAREIARYHGGDLLIDLESGRRDGRLNTFIFSFGRTAE